VAAHPALTTRWKPAGGDCGKHRL